MVSMRQSPTPRPISPTSSVYEPLHLLHPWTARGLRPSRSASNTTSGTDSSRSASHGGVVYMRSRPKVQDSRPATGGQSGAHGERPLVVRDPYQNIGIRNKGIGMREKTDWTDKQVCTGSDEVSTPSRFVSMSPRHGLIMSSSIFRCLPETRHPKRPRTPVRPRLHRATSRVPRRC